MSIEIKTVEQVCEDIQVIQNKLGVLKAKLLQCDVVYANVAVLPRSSIGESGQDSVYDPITSMSLRRLGGREAVEHTIEQIDFQYRNKDPFSDTTEALSQIGARRSVGIVHFKPRTNNDEQNIYDLVSEINGLKGDVKEDLKRLFSNTMQRTRLFYKRYYPEIWPKSMTNLIRIAAPSTTRIHFSWLNQGYSMEKMDRKKTIEFIDKINSIKLSNNPELGLSLEDLNRNDINRLGNYQSFYRMYPAKMNPRQQLTCIVDGSKKQMPPQRAVNPIIYLGQQPLEGYGELRDLNSLEEIRKCSNRSRVEHVPAIEEYGLFCFDTPQRVKKTPR